MDIQKQDMEQGRIMGILGREIANLELLKALHRSMFTKVFANESHLQQMKKLWLNNDNFNHSFTQSSLEEQLSRYFTQTQIAHLCSYFGMSNKTNRVQDILEKVLTDGHVDFNRLKIAKMLLLFIHEEISAEQAARYLEAFCHAVKPRCWHAVQFIRFLHFEKFVKAFKLTCLHHVFLENENKVPMQVATELPYLKNTSGEKTTSDLDSPELQSFFHSDRKIEEKKIMRTIEDYLDAYSLKNCL